MALFGQTFDTAGKARIAAYEAELQANASTDDWLADDVTPAQAKAQLLRGRVVNYARSNALSLGGLVNRLAAMGSALDLETTAELIAYCRRNALSLNGLIEEVHALRRELMLSAGFANLHLHSDVEPFEVVRVVSPKCIELRRMRATLSPDWKPKMHAGGFAANCSNQSSQEWLYACDFDAPVIRARLRKDGEFHSAYGRHLMAVNPRKFHDYNF